MFAKRPQAFASVRKRSRRVGHAGESKIVAKRRTVVTFGLVSSLRISKVSTVTGIGGSWSRNSELSSLLDSSRLFEFQKCRQSQGLGRSYFQSFREGTPINIKHKSHFRPNMWLQQILFESIQHTAGDAFLFHAMGHGSISGECAHA